MTITEVQSFGTSEDHDQLFPLLRLSTGLQDSAQLDYLHII